MIIQGIDVTDVMEAMATLTKYAPYELGALLGLNKEAHGKLAELAEWVPKAKVVADFQRP
jgi:hypothetical protein